METPINDKEKELYSKLLRRLGYTVTYIFMNKDYTGYVHFPWVKYEKGFKYHQKTLKDFYKNMYNSFTNTINNN